jgi:DNA-binding Lrp family transcriptional regulator
MATTTRKIAPRSAAEAPSLDATDRELLALLQANARESVTTLGKLGIARTTVIARMERLQKGGVITGYSVRLNRPRWRSHCRPTSGCRSRPAPGAMCSSGWRRCRRSLVCSVSGEFDYVAWIRAESPNALDRLLDEIGETEGVSKTTTSVVLAERINRGADASPVQ